MYCTDCRKEIPNGSRACRYCGAPLAPGLEPSPSVLPPRKKRSGRTWTLLVGLLCAAAVGIGLWTAPLLQARFQSGAGAYYAPSVPGMERANTVGTALSAHGIGREPGGAYAYRAQALAASPIGAVLKADEAGQQDMELQPDGSAVSVDVQDAYCYVGTADVETGIIGDELIENEGSQVEYRFPRVVIDGVSTDAVNAELWSGDESELFWVTDTQGRKYVSLYDLMTYDWYVTGDTLSILSIDRYAWGTVNYGVKNISVATGQFMTDDEVLAQAGLTREEFYAIAEDTLHKNFSTYLYQYCGGMDEETAFGYIESVETAKPFLNSLGHLSMVAIGAPMTADLPHVFLFDLQTQELFEVPGCEMVTRGDEDAQEVPAEDVPAQEVPADGTGAVVQDAFSYADIYHDPYDSQYDEPVEYHVPAVSYNGVSLDAVNEQLWNELYDATVAEEGYLTASEFFTGILSMKYDWYVNGDILSLLITERWGPENPLYSYNVYNISLSDGALLSTDAFFDRAGLSFEEYRATLRGLLAGYVNAYHDLLQYSDETYRERAITETLSGKHIGLSCPFLNNNGELCALAYIYYCYAPLEAYGFLFDLDTGRIYGEMAQEVNAEELAIVIPPAEDLPADDFVPAAGNDEWQVYNDMAEGENYIYNQIFLNPGTHEYIATVNLLEAYGTVIGSYTENTQDEVCCEIETKDFWGFGYDDATEFWLLWQDDKLTPLQSIWGISDYYHAEFEYSRSFTVTPDEGMGTITADGVSVYSGPSTEDVVLFEVSSGETVTIRGAADGWTMVEYVNESMIDYDLIAVGFVPSEYIARQ